MDTKISGKTLSELTNTLDDVTFTYEEAQITPKVSLNVAEDKVVTISFDDETTWHPFATEGIVYLGYRMGMGGTWLRRMVDFDAAFARDTLSHTAAMDKWVDAAPVMLAKTDGVVYGVLSKYTPLFHTNLVSGLAGLIEGAMASWTLSPTSLKMRFAKQADWLPGQVKLGITVENGTAGTVAFGFVYSIFTAQGNEWVRSKGGRARERHILPGDLDKVNKALSEAIEDATMEAFGNWLINHSFDLENIKAALGPVAYEEKEVAGKVLMAKIEKFAYGVSSFTASEWLEFSIDNLNPKITERIYNSFFSLFEDEIKLKSTKTTKK